MPEFISRGGEWVDATYAPKPNVKVEMEILPNEEIKQEARQEVPQETIVQAQELLKKAVALKKVAEKEIKKKKKK